MIYIWWSKLSNIKENLWNIIKIPLKSVNWGISLIFEKKKFIIMIIHLNTEGIDKQILLWDIYRKTNKQKKKC